MNQTPEQWDGLVRRLNDGGCPVLSDHTYKVRPVGLAIGMIPGMSFNSIFDLKQGGAGYAIEVALRNEATRPVDVVGWQVQTPWGIPKLALLPAPEKSSNRYPHYCFPEPGPYFEGDFCINRYFARRKSRLQPGEQIEGVLAASSEESIPMDIPHLARIVLTLQIFDSRRNAFAARFPVLVDRRERIAREKKEPDARASATVSVNQRKPQGFRRPSAVSMNPSSLHPIVDSQRRQRVRAVMPKPALAKFSSGRR